MVLRWHSFFIPGVFLLALGTIGVANWGLQPLPIGGVITGWLLLLAAVLQALAERDHED